MIWIQPVNATFAGQPLGRVEAVIVDRKAESPIVEFGQAGPYTQFVDVPRQRVTLTIEREVTQSEAMNIYPSQQGTLAFETGMSLSEAGRRRIAAGVVIVSVEHTLNTKRGMVQKIQAIAVSGTGTTDPVVETPIGEGEGA